MVSLPFPYHKHFRQEIWTRILPVVPENSFGMKEDLRNLSWGYYKIRRRKVDPGPVGSKDSIHT
jgi:predicted metalloenzyme YecM